MMTQDEITRNMLRRINEVRACEVAKRALNEAEEKAETPKETAIAITDDPRFGQQVMSTQIRAFRAAVDGGAEFAAADPQNPASSPLIFLPETKNLIFSGSIPSMGNLKFQMQLRSSACGLFIFCTQGTVLSDEALTKLYKLQGFYKSWVEEWNMESADLERLARIVEND